MCKRMLRATLWLGAGLEGAPLLPQPVAEPWHCVGYSAQGSQEYLQGLPKVVTVRLDMCVLP